MSLLMKAAHWSLKLGGRLPGKGDLGDLLHADVERLPRRFFQEGARARAAGFVHGIVRGHTVGDEGVLGVLAADFEDRVHSGSKKTAAVAWAMISLTMPSVRACRPAIWRPDPSRRGPRHGPLRATGPQLIEEGAVALARGPHGVAVGPQVDGGQRAWSDFAQQDGLGRGGAHVEAEDAAVSRPRIIPRSRVLNSTRPEKSSSGARLAKSEPSSGKSASDGR